MPFNISRQAPPWRMMNMEHGRGDKSLMKMALAINLANSRHWTTALKCRRGSRRRWIPLQAWSARAVRLKKSRFLKLKMRSKRSRRQRDLHLQLCPSPRSKLAGLQSPLSRSLSEVHTGLSCSKIWSLKWMTHSLSGLTSKRISSWSGHQPRSLTKTTVWCLKPNTSFTSNTSEMNRTFMNWMRLG